MITSGDKKMWSKIFTNSLKYTVVYSDDSSHYSLHTALLALRADHRTRYRAANISVSHSFNSDETFSIEMKKYFVQTFVKRLIQMVIF